MEETVIVIMIKEHQTGFLGKELASCSIVRHDELLLNAFAVESETGLQIVLRLNCSGEVTDEEFDAVYDYYDEAVYEGLGVLISEYEDCYNPTWELVFPYDSDTFAAKINTLLDIHARELEDVFRIIRTESSGN